MTKRNIHRTVYLVFFLIFSCHPAGFAQTLHATVDRNEILIGEPIKYTVTAVFPTSSFTTQWFTVPDSVAHFEVVERGKIDTVVAGQSTTLQQVITYTSFDSGKWNTPGLPVSFAALPGGSATNLYTDSLPVNVTYSPSDSTATLRDIKPIQEVTVKDYALYYIAGIVLLLLAAVWLTWKYIKQRPKKDKTAEKAAATAYQEAMMELEELKRYDLRQPADIKLYHTRLSAIFRRYLGRRSGRGMMTATSSEVLIALSSFGFGHTDIPEVAGALRCGDAVKFAKYLPGTIESEGQLATIRLAIDRAENHLKSHT